MSCAVSSPMSCAVSRQASVSLPLTSSWRMWPVSSSRSGAEVPAMSCAVSSPMSCAVLADVAS
jgi:hypothetical protein